MKLEGARQRGGMDNLIVHTIIIVHNRESGACSGILQGQTCLFLFHQSGSGLGRERLGKKGGQLEVATIV